MKIKDPFEDWAPIMYRILKEYGIKPWEFGELTYPWLMMIMEGSKGSISRPIDERQISKSRDLAQKMASLIGKPGANLGSIS